MAGCVVCTAEIGLGTSATAIWRGDPVGIELKLTIQAATDDIDTKLSRIGHLKLEVLSWLLLLCRCVAGFHSNV